MKNETRIFVDRIADGALDTIATAAIFQGRSGWTFDDPEVRRIARHIAWGTFAHFANLAEQADATEALGDVMEKIARHWIADA